MKKPTLAVILCCTFFPFVSGNAHAQNATLKGAVRDAESRDPLPSANVIVFSTAIQTGAATSADGRFEINNLPPGSYTVTVTYIGYEKQTLTAVILAAGETKTLTIQLKLTGIELNPISVSASRRAEKTLEAPASISVLEPKDLIQEVAPSSDAALRNVTGIDFATTGIDRREIVLRGFNNAFSGAAYVLTDYRKAAVPSLDVNIHSIMPNLNIDLEKVEIVRGPGSALYGAGVDAGVIHYLTKDPLGSPGTTATFSGGERASFAGQFRHAGGIGQRFGYKITGQYAQADDWTLDPSDSLDAVELGRDFTDPNTGQKIQRDNDYQKLNLNGLLQYRFSDNVALTANGGYSALDATVLSGIGTVQAENFGYSYAQLRLQANKFFAQAYLNRNNAGDSFIYGIGRPVVDNSVLLNLQAQYDLELMKGKEQLILGVDYDRTTPDTKGTIFGRNENRDLISEFGVYAQSLTKLHSKLDITVALRADNNNIEDGVQFSPRAAIVFKPTPGHSFRATYNRAYSLPGSTSLFLDIVARETALFPGFSIFERGRGSINGFTFETARSGGGITGSGLLPVEGIYGMNMFTYPGAGVPVQNVPMEALYEIIYRGLEAIPTEVLQDSLAARGINLSPQLIEFFVNQLSPQNTQVNGLASSALESEPVDVEPLKSTITHTFEVGYKGLLNQKLLVAVDWYYTRKKNFISGVTQLTPLAFLSNLADELTPAIAEGIRNNRVLNPLLGLAGLSADTVAAVLVAFSAPQLQQLPVAVVQPDQNMTPGEIIGAYRNFGNVDFWGLDVSLQYLVSSRFNLFGNVSFVSDDLFDENELEEPGSGLEVALNAPKFKAKGGLGYHAPYGFSFNAAARYTQGFPVRSGPYVGFVDDYFLLDVGAGYDLDRWVHGMRVDMTIQNVLNNEHREFIGAPKIGRLGLARISYTF